MSIWKRGKNRVEPETLVVMMRASVMVQLFCFQLYLAKPDGVEKMIHEIITRMRMVGWRM